MRWPWIPSHDLTSFGPLPLTPDEAFVLLEEAAAEEALRISLISPEGAEIGSISGSLALPKKIAGRDGQVFAEFDCAEGGVATTIRLPLRTDSDCTMESTGLVAAKLPSGASWSVGALDEAGAGHGADRT